MCAIYLLRIILLVNNIRVRNFRHFGWNENFLTTKISRITVCPGPIQSCTMIDFAIAEPHAVHTFSVNPPLANSDHGGIRI